MKHPGREVYTPVQRPGMDFTQFQQASVQSRTFNEVRSEMFVRICNFGENHAYLWIILVIYTSLFKKNLM